MGSDDIEPLSEERVAEDSESAPGALDARDVEMLRAAKASELEAEAAARLRAIEGLISEPGIPSEVCNRLGKLKSSSLKAISRRERVPQPLFWSLFYSEIAEIKRRKEKRRLRKQLELGF